MQAAEIDLTYGRIITSFDINSKARLPAAIDSFLHWLNQGL